LNAKHQTGEPLGSTAEFRFKGKHKKEYKPIYYLLATLST